MCAIRMWLTCKDIGLRIKVLGYGGESWHCGDVPNNDTTAQDRVERHHYYFQDQ